MGLGVKGGGGLVGGLGVNFGFSLLWKGGLNLKVSPIPPSKGAPSELVRLPSEAFFSFLQTASPVHSSIS